MLKFKQGMGCGVWDVYVGDQKVGTVCRVYRYGYNYWNAIHSTREQAGASLLQVSVDPSPATGFPYCI